MSTLITNIFNLINEGILKCAQKIHEEFPHISVNSVFAILRTQQFMPFLYI